MFRCFILVDKCCKAQPLRLPHQPQATLQLQQQPPPHKVSLSLLSWPTFAADTCVLSSLTVVTALSGHQCSFQPCLGLRMLLKSLYHYDNC